MKLKLPPLRTLPLLAIKAALTVAFLALGIGKLVGLEPMLGTFAAIGWGQWFRYVAGAIEVAGAVLIWVPNRQALGAAFLLCTCLGALLAHALVLGPMVLPAIGLGILSALALYLHLRRP